MIGTGTNLLLRLWLNDEPARNKRIDALLADHGGTPGSPLVTDVVLAESVQVLEGERSTVNRLYAQILADPRHKDVEMLHFEEITQRRYPDWSMALVNLSDRDPMAQMQHPEFDPFSASGAFMMQFVHELIASGRPILHPAD